MLAQGWVLSGVPISVRSVCCPFLFPVLSPVGAGRDRQDPSTEASSLDVAALTWPSQSPAERHAAARSSASPAKSYAELVQRSMSGTTPRWIDAVADVKPSRR
jgi:hypothetical protein